MAGSKDRYTEFCQINYVPVHLQPWWLDAVCGSAGNWDVVLAGGRHQTVQGAWPFFLSRHWGLRVIRLPPFTAYGGPWLIAPPDPLNVYQRQTFEHKTLNRLIEQLPGVVFFRQAFRPEMRNCLPLLWAGFQQTTRYTYLLPDTSDTAMLHAGLRNTLRNEIRKAEQWVVCVSEDDPDLVFRLNRLSFLRKGLRFPYAPEPFRRLHETLAGRGQFRCLIARDRRSGRAHAGLYLAFDDRTASVILTGMDSGFRKSGALHSLYWEAVRFCHTRGLALDFEGSMQSGIEWVFRGFGARLTPYSQVWKGPV